MPAKTELEKMLAGEIYNCLNASLAARREQAKELFRAFNAAATEPERDLLLQSLLGRLGPNSTIEPPFFCSYGRHIFIGANVYLNFNCTILDNNEVHLGDEVMLGPAVQIYTAVHPLDAATRIQRLETAEPVVIEANVWVGGGAIILPGVTIGRNAVVGAGAVVTKNVPANSVVVGNPGQVVRVVGE